MPYPHFCLSLSLFFNSLNFVLLHCCFIPPLRCLPLPSPLSSLLSALPLTTSQCWCGNALSPGAVPAPMTDCKMTCNDNSTELCGGPSRLNAYIYQGNWSSTTSVTADTRYLQTTTLTSGLDSTTPLGSSPTPAIPTHPPNGPYRRAQIGKWVYQGCWTEATRGHALRDRIRTNDSMTLDLCAEICDGLTYFGVEYGRECYCGRALQPGSVKAANQADCKFLCPGNKTQYCGAGVRLELYKIGDTSPASSISALTSPPVTAPSLPTTRFASSSQEGGKYPDVTNSPVEVVSPAPGPAPAPGPVISDGNANFTYLACVAEPSRGRLLATQILNHVNMTIHMCLQTCWEYNYAGVEYGRECWCGNTVNYGGNGGLTAPGRNVSNAECGFLCLGNGTEFCGGRMRVSMYERRGMDGGY